MYLVGQIGSVQKRGTIGSRMGCPQLQPKTAGSSSVNYLTGEMNAKTNAKIKTLSKIKRERREEVWVYGFCGRRSSAVRNGDIQY